jgi:hypothetical protein
MCGFDGEEQLRMRQATLILSCNALTPAKAGEVMENDVDILL